LQGYDEKTSYHTIVNLHTFHHTYYRYCCGNSDTGACGPIPYHSGLCLLLVYNQFYTLWAEDSKEAMSVLS